MKQVLFLACVLPLAAQQDSQSMIAAIKAEGLRSRLKELGEL